MNKVELIEAGLTDYRQAWQLQQELFKKVEESRNHNYLILTEHPPVITIGKTGSEDNLQDPHTVLDTRGIEVIHVDRGGDVTFHGPGQLVGYPVLNLMQFQKDVHWYLRTLEDMIINTLARFSIDGERIDGMTGVWIGNNKICAMGIKVTRWVTMHGFALNVDTNLDYFNHIIPCGIEDKGVTSITKEVGNNIPIKDVINILLENFQKTFNVELTTSTKSAKNI